METAIPLETVIGLVLAFLSCFFIGISVVFKKLALKEIEIIGGTRAVDGGYGYLKLPKWWLGIVLMGAGELTNFVAYMYAPAILVTPLGVFSIVFTTILSPYFLKETLQILGKIGCILVLVGCVIVTLCGPKDREISTMLELQNQLLNPGFLIYASIVIITSTLFMYLVTKHRHKYVMMYITICSSYGSLSVMFCKGVGLALKQTIHGMNQFTHWATWVCLISLIICLIIETVYMQRALDLFSSSTFMSINYVMFTSLVIIASSILYTEFQLLGAKNIILTILGFVVNITALYLLHLNKLETDEVQEFTNNSDNNEKNNKNLSEKQNFDKKSNSSDLFKSEFQCSPSLSNRMNMSVKRYKPFERNNSQFSLLQSNVDDTQCLHENSFNKYSYRSISSASDDSKGSDGLQNKNTNYSNSLNSEKNSLYYIDSVP